MSNIVIQATDISKQYRLGVVGSGSLKDDIARFWANLTGKEDPTLKLGQLNDRTQKGVSDYVWALKDINFEVKQGEILGIIGKNGAGKSTLLKILSKITAPTTGSIKIKGRIASLLEVGTGFHGELTGRENIYLNGAILGMSRNEITKKLDEIIAFAGVEKYIDTPVKRYSSGMTVRLGFAVAAHLDPDILVVDEVLAVGDAEFQKKAIGKMQDVSTQEGRTILFVSHHMGSVKDLCDRAILLENGSIKEEGSTNSIINSYLESSFIQKIDKNTALDDSKHRRGSGHVRITTIKIVDKNGQERNVFHTNETIIFELECEILKEIDEIYVSMAFKMETTKDIITNLPKSKLNIKLEIGKKINYSFTLNNNPFRLGSYELYFWLGSSQQENPYDVVDGLTKPIIIRPRDNENPISVGFFNINSEDIILKS